ncbi:hypothetical protein QQP08_006399 [Theobroma cacao]|nr:hypothetical protein QQP08_006399 [Theobroma cacao]
MTLSPRITTNSTSLKSPDLKASPSIVKTKDLMLVFPMAEFSNGMDQILVGKSLSFLLQPDAYFGLPVVGSNGGVA